MAAPTDADETSLYSWGANSYGQLGQDHTEDQLLPGHVTVSCDLRIKSICGGGGHTFVITDDFVVYTCGQNTKGQLGLGHNETNVYTVQPVRHLLDKRITKIACGWDFSLAMTESGSLYAWGSNGFGQLGLPDVKTSTNLPTVVPVPGRVVDIAAGMRHSALVTDVGEVYSFGAGRKGQLGVTENMKPPAKVTEPVTVPLPANLGKIHQVAAGSHHTAALTESGDVVVWGDSKYGQHSSGSTSHTQLSKDLFGGRPVVQIHSGWTHMLAVTDTGQVYSWGRGDYGQLGRPLSGQCDSVPAVIPGLQHPVQVCCGSEHSLAITESGELVTWGWNEHGMCASGAEENVAEPRVVKMFKSGTVSLIGSGAGHSLAILKS